MNNLNSNKSDLIIENQLTKIDFNKNDTFVIVNKKEQFTYKTIYFKSLIYSDSIKDLLKKEILLFINQFNLPQNYHAFIVGIGNDNHTADSIGPKTLKHIIVNSHFEKLGLKIDYPKVSALEPGVLGETGISTKKIIESVVNEIEPDLIILIDSYVSENIDFLNKCIQITDEGITPGSGLHHVNTEINYNTFHIPIIVIGVPTAIEINLDSDNSTYLLSTKDIDTYVNKISKIIGEAINDSLYYK